jgi:hypothetical protein
VIGTTILSITVKPVYDTILVIMGPGGFLFNYADDVYLGENVARALAAAPRLYGMTGISLG